VALWAACYFTPREGAGPEAETDSGPVITLSLLLAQRPVLVIAAAKFLTDAAWYFYLFWLPKYLFEAQHFDLKQAGNLGWIPYAASGVGCLVGGGLSSMLLRRGASVNAARKIALGASAACMPWVMLVPMMPNVAMVLTIFSLAFFGQQSWSTLVMVLPTDLVPRRALGKFAGLVGLGGAMGGVVLGQAAGWMLDHGFSYTPVLTIAASLHLIAFALICLGVPRLRQLSFTR
jgi:ACS family hexuronate transporter-like MFS transporter